MLNESYCKLLETTPEYIADIICDMNVNGPVSSDYMRKIAEEIAEEVAHDIYETTDREEWDCDDVRLATGRVLCKRLNLSV